MARITDYKIIIPKNPVMNERRAAQFLCRCIKLVCGKKLPILTDDTPATDLEIAVGRTNREALDGICFARSEEGIWEYEIKTVNGRVYLAGLGSFAKGPFVSSYRIYEDGQLTTVYAAYRFVEDVLGYSFMDADYHSFPQNPDLEMPADYNVTYTKAALARQFPEKIRGAAMYLVPSCHHLDWNMSCVIFPGSSGRSVTFD